MNRAIVREQSHNMPHNISRNMPNSTKTLFLHIPKTAGTTFYDCLKKIYGKRRIVEFHGIPKNTIDDFRTNIYNPRMSDISCIKGHMYFGLHQYLNEPSRYITFMRNPVKRVISLYRYLRQSKHHKQHALAANKSLAEFTVACTLHNNGQTRFLAGGKLLDSPEILLDRAKENLKYHFSVIGLTERFDESLVLFKQSLNWAAYPTYTRENISGKRESNIVDAETLSLIEQHNAVDILLYQYAETLFKQQIQQFSGDFASELEGFRQKQIGFSRLNHFYSTSRSIYLGIRNKIAGL